jgi:predicted dehydrogenase
VPGFNRVADIELVAVANRTRASSEAAAAEHDIPEICGTWQDLIARDDLDIVVIGTYPYTHREMTAAALEAGKHVFCQARMALDFADAKVMFDHARQHDRVVGLCPVPIGMKVDRTITRMLREGALGDVHLVRVQGMADAYLDPEAPMNWRKDECLSGLNMLTLGMYVEVIHRWFGWTQAVSATTQTFVPERVDETGERRTVRIPDQILFNTEQEGGFPVQYVISAAVKNGTDAIEIYGTKKTLRYELPSDVLYEVGEGGALKPVTISPEDAYDVETWRVEEDFVAAIREGKDYHPNLEDGLRYMQVVQAVYDSAESGGVVRLVDPTG